MRRRSFNFRGIPAMKLACAGLATAIASISQSGCDRQQADVPSTNVAIAPSAAAPQTVPAVELSEAQQNAIKVEPAGPYPFLIEREAVGSVSFDEDLPIVQAESTLIGAAATFTLSQKELARLQSLGEANGIAQKDLEQAMADQETAAAALKAARDAVRALGKTEAQIERIVATGKYERATRRKSVKWVVANITESDSPLVRVGQAVGVTVKPFPDQVYAGRIARIYATLDPDTHRMSTRAQVADPKDELRPGMLAEVTIHIGGPVDSLAVPATAVVREGDGTMVAWVTRDHRHFQQRPVKLGLQRAGRYQVLEGLQPGELVVVEGGVFLSNLLEAPPSD
jgi:cobalt-zinc-cadmium efflux system membrane fusion protein